MKHWGMLLFLTTSGCTAGPTAYRAHFASETEVEGIRACAEACRQSSDAGLDPHSCLAACPGFSPHRGDRCTLGREEPGTYCVTVEDRVVPSEAFWSAFFEAAVDEALRASSEPDSSGEPSSDSSSEASETRASARDSERHTGARPSVGRESSSRRSASREKRGPIR